MNVEVRKTLARKLALYYGALVILLLLLGYLQPEWLKYLPLGGLEDLQKEAALPEEGGVLANLLATHKPLAIFDDAMNLVTALAGTLIVMIPVRWIYMTEGLKKTINPDVAMGLLLLPMVVTAIVFIVKYSLPLAFALTGIFAGVRYRTTLKNQSDAYFTFASIAIGLAAGIRALGIGVVLAIFFAFTILVLLPGVSKDNMYEG
jgi:hypothetical protein